jgi:hypothetical protein
LKLGAERVAPASSPPAASNRGHNGRSIPVVGGVKNYVCILLPEGSEGGSNKTGGNVVLDAVYARSSTEVNGHQAPKQCVRRNFLSTVVCVLYSFYGSWHGGMVVVCGNCQLSLRPYCVLSIVPANQLFPHYLLSLFRES